MREILSVVCADRADRDDVAAAHDDDRPAPRRDVLQRIVWRLCLGVNERRPAAVTNDLQVIGVFGEPDRHRSFSRCRLSAISTAMRAAQTTRIATTMTGHVMNQSVKLIGAVSMPCPVFSR